MKPQSLHAHEDRLLDFAYGELPPLEARALESHLEGCSRCTELLDGIRGVRTTMAQLPMEPAPEAGLESLLAYAQQAARNAAAGPPPRPTWWRRWLMPAMGVAAVSVFGILSIQVSKTVDLSPELSAQSVKKESAPLAVATPEPVPAPAAAAPPPPAPPADEEPAMDTLREGNAYPPPASSGKLDRASLGLEGKVAPRKAFEAAPKGSAWSDWSNAGTGGGFAKDEEELGNKEQEVAKKKRSKSYEYDRRDAMTQAGAFSKPKPILVSPPPEPSTPAASEPAAGPTPPADAQLAKQEQEVGEDKLVAQAEVQEQAPQGGLRLGGGSSRGNEASALESSDSDDAFADQLGSRTSESRREQVAQSNAPPSPPLAAVPVPMPSAGIPATRSTSVPAKPAPAQAAPVMRPEEKKSSSSSELAREANAALRSGDRVLEVQLLRQALAAGASGTERLGLLNRLCDAEFAIGRRQAAIEACTLVLEEDPRSNAAQMARGRLRREAPETEKMPARRGSKAPAKAAEMPAPAPPPAPANAH